MSSAAKHVWGVSAVRDRVWSHVNGLGSEKARSRLLAVWQAYVDESFDERFFVIGGFIASAETWADFSDEWAALLPYTRLRSDDGTYEFKMSEMAKNPERMERAQAFFRIIEEKMSVWTMYTMRLDDVENARQRIVVVRADGSLISINLGFLANDYMFAWVMYLREFFRARQDLQQFGVPIDQKIDFIFDERLHEKSTLLNSWDYFVSELKENKHLTGATPRFENSDEFMPLQAADFMCWWVREWLHQAREREIESMAFPWSRKKGLGFTYTYQSEDQILQFMLGTVRVHLKSLGIDNAVVCDAYDLP